MNIQEPGEGAGAAGAVEEGEGGEGGVTMNSPTEDKKSNTLRILGSKAEGGCHWYLILDTKDDTLSWRSLDASVPMMGMIMRYMRYRVYKRSKLLPEFRKEAQPKPVIVTEPEPLDEPEATPKKKGRKRDTPNRLARRDLKKLDVKDFIDDIDAILGRRICSGEMCYLVRWKTDPEVASKYERKANFVTFGQLSSCARGKQMMEKWDLAEGTTIVAEKPKDFLTKFWENN
eukprot:TRINITY_DN2175_c0_g1_i1.p1 TRINITY_DN2175_c0_g1~~TRINITY_DN2175_c0_g1_i1.p1  ORF type:complete len:230 (-),score=35.97 TRINITY_DN2175_c0_g1_i1:57-746(-)